MRTLLKKLYYWLTGRSITIRSTCSVQHDWYGNEYGGFYVYPENLNEKSIVYSFGIGEDVSFDLELIKRHNCQVFGFDPTPKSIQWITRQKLPANFSFHPYGIAKVSGYADFFLPKNDLNVSGSMLQNTNVDIGKTVRVKMKSIVDIMRELNHQHIDLLKMDIEGAEYDVLEEIIKSGVPINQILVEFHHRMMRGGGRLTKKSIRILQQNGYEIFGVSEKMEEISFIKKPL